MEILAIDFETQDDKPETTRITEVGCALATLAPCPLDGEPKLQLTKEIKKASWFCYEPDYPPQDEFIVELTGITDEMLKTKGMTRNRVFIDHLLPLVHRADVIFAHKKAFDQTIFESTCRKFGLEIPRKEWICSLSEFQWPRKFTCHKLGHLAFEHGMFDEPDEGYGVPKRTMLHRAGDDAELLLQLITNYYSIDDVIGYAREPWYYFKADILPPWKDGGEQSGIAKKLGFTYEKCKHSENPIWSKTWVQRVKARNREQIEKIREKVRASSSPFRVSVIEGLN